MPPMKTIKCKHGTFTGNVTCGNCRREKQEARLKPYQQLTKNYLKTLDEMRQRVAFSRTTEDFPSKSMAIMQYDDLIKSRLLIEAGLTKDTPNDLLDAFKFAAEVLGNCERVFN